MGLPKSLRDLLGPPYENSPYDITPRAEVDECRVILGCSLAPSWWPIAQEYIDRFNAEHPIVEEA